MQPLILTNYVTLIYNMAQRIFISKVHQGESLLKTLAKKNIEPYYECCQGHCGTCKTRLIKGEVRYAQTPLTDVDEGECLICCAYPVTDVVLEIS